MIVVSVKAAPIIINVGGKIISISPPSDLPSLYSIPTNTIFTVTIPGQTNYQVSYSVFTNWITEVSISNGAIVLPLAASNIFSGGVLPTGTLTSGTTNLAGHLFVVTGTTRQITYNGGLITNIQSALTTTLATNAILATNAVYASKVALPYNGYVIGNRFINNFNNNKVTKVMFTWDSYAGHNFGGVAFPWPEQIAADGYQAAYNWYANGAYSSSFAKPPPAAGETYGVFPDYYNSFADADPSYFNQAVICPLAPIWWGLHGGYEETYGPYTNVNNLMVCWWQWPLGGNNLILYTNNVQMMVLNGFNATSTNSAATNISVATGTYTIGVGTTSTSNTNMLFGGTAWNTTNGVVFFYSQEGGTSYNVVQQSAPAYSNFWNAISPDIAYIVDKHTPSDTPSVAAADIAQVYQTENSSFSNQSNTLWAIVGSCENGTPPGADEGAYINMVYYNLCVSSNWSYIDLHTDNNTWTNILTTDGIHPNYLGRAWGAAKWEEEIGFPAGADTVVAFMDSYITNMFGNGAGITNLSGVAYTNFANTFYNAQKFNSGMESLSGGNMTFGYTDGTDPAINPASGVMNLLENGNNGWQFYGQTGTAGSVPFVSINGFSGGITLYGYIGSQSTALAFASGNQLFEQFVLSGFSSGQNYTTGSVGERPVALGGPNGWTGETNGVFEVYSNLIVNNGNIILTNGTIQDALGYYIGQIVNTNFISGKLYTNSYGNPIQISAMVGLTVAAVSGDASMSLQVPGSVTNVCGMSTLITSIAMTYTNAIPTTFVPSGSSYVFTNLSTGAGNSATVSGGQIIIY